MVFSKSKKSLYIWVFKPSQSHLPHFPIPAIMKKHLSMEEVLHLVLDGPSDSESDSKIDILSVDVPSVKGPEAVKISAPYELDTTNAVYQNLQPMQEAPHICTCSSSDSSQEQEYMCTCSNQSSPTISPASIPSLLKLKQQRSNLKPPDQKSKIPQKTGKPPVNKLPSHIPVRCTSTPLPTPKHPIIMIFSSSEISDTERSSECITNSPPSSQDGSHYLPPKQFPNLPNLTMYRKILMKWMCPWIILTWARP